MSKKNFCVKNLWEKQNHLAVLGKILLIRRGCIGWQAMTLVCLAYSF